jgi:hypothetical protein
MKKTRKKTKMLPEKGKTTSPISPLRVKSRTVQSPHARSPARPSREQVQAAPWLAIAA